MYFLLRKTIRYIYLCMGRVPASNPTGLHKIKRSFWLRYENSFVIIHIFFKKYFLDQLLGRCVSASEFESIIFLCHSKVYEDHFSSKKTGTTILPCGFYWPTLLKDTCKFCKICASCQKLG